jgi:hypothetical protein
MDAGTGNGKLPKLSAKIMMNLWVFSGVFGDASKNVYPFHSEYEYFRFYKWNNETTYPYETPKTMLPMEDVDFAQNNPKEATYP